MAFTNAAEADFETGFTGEAQIKFFDDVETQLPVLGHALNFLFDAFDLSGFDSEMIGYVELRDTNGVLLGRLAAVEVE